VIQKRLFVIAALVSISLACFVLPVPGGMTPVLPADTATNSRRFAPSTTPTLSSPTPNPTCRVNTAVLNLRACAGTHCTTRTWLREGETVTILSHQHQWLHVQTQSRDTGWVHSKFCTGEQP
jgi:uncharacterized protein YgiM (DUF1202 family)